MAQREANDAVLVGFDGFVDEIIHLVDARIDFDEFKRLDTLSAFAERIAAAAGYSANIEMVPVQVKLGGNGPIMADALRHMGFRVNYVGAIGGESIHPVFQDFAAGCERVISLCEPAVTEALEFRDGKLMMGKMETLKNVSWETLLRHIPERDLSDLLGRVSLVACVNWTMLPLMNSIFVGLTGLLSGLSRRLKVFVDLTDPRKRTASDIGEALSLLSAMQKHADVILGMNENESMQVEQVILESGVDSVPERAIRIREKLAIHMAVIHPVRSACVSAEEGVFHLDGPFTSHPKLMTGAGDVFNAGFCKGLLSGLPPHECLGTGVCSSGFYVRNARPPRHADLVDFMHHWSATDCGAI